MTQWNTETIRQQRQFSNMPPASTDEYKFLFQWHDHWLKNTFFAFVELLDVWFAVEGSSEAWGAVLWRLKLVWTLAWQGIPLWASTHLQDALVASWPFLLFPASPSPSETLLRAAFSVLTSPAPSLFFPQSISKLLLCAVPWASALSQEKQQVEEGKRQNVLILLQFGLRGSVMAPGEKERIIPGLLNNRLPRVIEQPIRRKICLTTIGPWSTRELVVHYWCVKKHKTI